MPATEEQSEQVERQEAHVQALAPVDSSKPEVLRAAQADPAAVRARPRSPVPHRVAPRSSAPLAQCLPAPAAAALYRGGSGRRAGGGHTAARADPSAPHARTHHRRAAAPGDSSAARRGGSRLEASLLPRSPAGSPPWGGLRQLLLATAGPRSLLSPPSPEGRQPSGRGGSLTEKPTEQPQPPGERVKGALAPLSPSPLTPTAAAPPTAARGASLRRRCAGAVGPRPSRERRCAEGAGAARGVAQGPAVARCSGGGKRGGCEPGVTGASPAHRAGCLPAHLAV